MDCVICSGGETEAGETTIAFSRGATTVVVKAVPADVCDQCGEEYISAGISERLLQMVETAARKGGELELLYFHAA